jgi:hypothetical protein
MHVPPFGIIKILGEMKALFSSFAEGRPAVDGGLLGPLWHMDQLCNEIALFWALEAKQSLAKSRACSSL